MRGIITKIDPEKPGSGGRTFIRVYFELHKGDDPAQWAKTDLCPQFRNFLRWKRLLKVGYVIDGLVLKTSTTVDADSLPRRAAENEPPADESQAPVQRAGASPARPKSLEGYVIRHRTTGLFMSEDKNELGVVSDQWVHNGCDATHFAEKGDPKKPKPGTALFAIKKYELTREHYSLVGPKET